MTVQSNVNERASACAADISTRAMVTIIDRIATSSRDEEATTVPRAGVSGCAHERLLWTGWATDSAAVLPRHAARVRGDRRGTRAGQAGGLEAAPVTTAFEADDAPETRRLEMPGSDQDLLALQPLQQGAAGLARQLGIHVGTRHPVGLLDLNRAVRGVAQHERPLTLRGDEDAHVTRSVPGGWDRGQLARDRVLTPHELDEAELLQRPDTARRVGKARRLK